MAAGLCAAAARAPRPSPPLLSLPPLRLLLLYLVMAVGVAASSACTSRLEVCADAFREAEERQGASDACGALLRYSECVRQNPGICRGNLIYHTTLSILRGKIVSKNCTSAATVPQRTFPPSTSPPTTSLPADLCRFKGLQEFRHCQLFGDPHLKTFFSEFQTCRVQGAWPLIDNPFLGVQVTNDQVRPHSPATATTKVTIVIRRRENHPCTQEKTYQATSETTGLPSTFIDGTQRSSSPEDAIVLKVLSAEHVEIHVRYLDAVLVVRQSGRWLAFSARLPVELLVGTSQSDLQLCVRGCPGVEQLTGVARGATLSHQAAWARCRDANTSSSARARTRPQVPALTHEYLDWCIFDVMTTGDQEADFFTAAAYHAQEDVLRLDPASLHNRTTARAPPEGAASAATGPRQRSGSPPAALRADAMEQLLVPLAAVLVMLMTCSSIENSLQPKLAVFRN